MCIPQKEKVSDILYKSFDTLETDTPSIVLQKENIEKIIFGCMVICKGSTEDTQKFIEQILGIHVSIGKISNIINFFCQ